MNIAKFVMYVTLAD